MVFTVINDLVVGTAIIINLELLKRHLETGNMLDLYSAIYLTLGIVISIMFKVYGEKIIVNKYKAKLLADIRSKEISDNEFVQKANEYLEDKRNAEILGETIKVEQLDKEFELVLMERQVSKSGIIRGE